MAWILIKRKFYRSIKVDNVELITLIQYKLSDITLCQN